MAKLVMGDKVEDVPDGDLIISACKKFGIVFGCEVGVCGSCRVKVLEGMENLSERSQEEKDFGFLADDERLSCQCRIKSGVVKIKDAFE